jgi:hypothetical protein
MGCGASSQLAAVEASAGPGLSAPRNAKLSRANSSFVFRAPVATAPGEVRRRFDLFRVLQGFVRSLKITEEDVADFVAAFSKRDANRNGVIPIEDFAHALGIPLRDGISERLLVVLDPEHSGCVNYKCRSPRTKPTP